MSHFLRNLLVRNWGLKIFSFILAFLLWLILIPEEKTYSDKTLAAALEIHNVPPHMEIVEKPVSSIDVTVRARNRIINTLSPSAIVVRMDLEKASIYQDIYPLNSSMIILPEGTELVRFSPNMIRIKLEKTKQTDLPVVPMIIGQAREGLRIIRIDVTPSRIPVRGPESKIRSRDKVSTTPIDLSILTQSTTLEADLILPNPDLQLATALTKARITVILEENLSPSNSGAVKKK